jgi:hypothetical protein
MGGQGPPGPHGIQAWQPGGRTQLPILGIRNGQDTS